MFWVEKLQTKLTEFVNKIVSPEFKLAETKETQEMDEKYAKERHSLFGEVAESAVARRLPTRWKVADLFTSVGLRKWDPEAVKRQKEFESITAWTMFVPDFLLKNVTNMIIKIPWFQKLVENYPLWGKVKTQLLAEGANPDPDQVINFLRVVNQDIVTGKVGLEKISK